MYSTISVAKKILGEITSSPKCTCIFEKKQNCDFFSKLVATQLHHYSLFDSIWWKIAEDTSNDYVEDENDLLVIPWDQIVTAVVLLLVHTISLLHHFLFLPFWPPPINISKMYSCITTASTYVCTYQRLHAGRYLHT